VSRAGRGRLNHLASMVRRDGIASTVRLVAGHRRERLEMAWRDRNDYHRPVLTMEPSNELLRDIVAARQPCMVSRLGAVELRCVSHYLGHRGRHPRPYLSDVADMLRTNAGFFPTTDEALDRFASTYLDAVRSADVMCVWPGQWEKEVLRVYCPAATLIPLAAVEPFRQTEPWSAALADKKVLVIHPYAESILENYRDRRDHLFAHPGTLPRFELDVLPAVQSSAGRQAEYATWFDALAAMKASLESRTFDVCIIGAGAYGLPLAAHVKRLGKVAVHLGGATQILFGIRGWRWDKDPIVSALYNDYWTRPKASETPQSHKTVEDGCYW